MKRSQNLRDSHVSDVELRNSQQKEERNKMPLLRTKAQSQGGIE